MLTILILTESSPGFTEGAVQGLNAVTALANLPHLKLVITLRTWPLPFKSGGSGTRNLLGMALSPKMRLCGQIGPVQ